MDKSSQHSEPKFLLIKSSSGSLSKASPFLIEKCIRNHAGVVKSVRKVVSGLLVETFNFEQSRKLQKMRMLGDISVDVTPHPRLNSCRGVISCRDLLNCSVDEICEGLRDQGVTHVRRISVLRNGIREETPTCILTFDRPELPDKIKAGFYSLPVRLYIPPPMRCYRCQKFGHTSTRCESTQLCVCGDEPHEGEMCKQPFRCPNCTGNHAANSRSCPIYLEEKEIQNIKFREHVSYTEARRKLRRNYPKKSFANVAASEVPSCNTNLDVKKLAAELVPEILKLISVKQKESVDESIKALAPYGNHSDTRSMSNRKTGKDCSHAGNFELEANLSSTSIVKQIDQCVSRNSKVTFERIKSPDLSDASRSSTNRLRHSSSSSGEYPPLKKRNTSPPRDHSTIDGKESRMVAEETVYEHSPSDLDSNPDLYTAESDTLPSTEEMKVTGEAKSNWRKCKPRKYR